MMENNFNQAIIQYNNFIFNQQPNMRVFTSKFEEKEINQINKQDLKYRTRCPFTKQEDKQLLQLVQLYGIDNKYNWYLIAYHIPGRTARQCRERYQLFLSEGIKRKVKWTKEEDDLLLSKYNVIGPHWKEMEEFFEGRTSYNIKNRFISLNRKKRKELNSLSNENISIKNEKKSLCEDMDDNYLNYLHFDNDDLQIQHDYDDFNQFDPINL